MDCYQPLLGQIEVYLREFVAPQAEVIDRHPEALYSALKGLGEHGHLALRVPQIWGGAGMSDITYRCFQELVARYSGALAFLQTQHQSAGSMLAQSANAALKQAYLPRMGRGEALVGIGFSQLRRQPPPVKAIAVAGGYQLDGAVPWVTGFEFFQAFVVAGVLPDGQAVFGLVPFVDTQQDAGAIAFSQPLQLAAMASTNTVTASLTQWFLSHSQVVDIKPAGWIQANDRKNVLHHGFFALGCARAGLDILERTSQTKPLLCLTTAFASLNQELIDCQTAIAQVQQQPIDSAAAYNQCLQLRAWTIDLAVRCAHAAVAVSRGAANYNTHAAQRVYREALAFTVFGQTTAVMEATLSRLTRTESAI